MKVKALHHAFGLVKVVLAVKNARAFYRRIYSFPFDPFWTGRLLSLPLLSAGGFTRRLVDSTALYTDMFATIRKHQRWLFILICGVVIVSFVVFFSPDVGMGRGRGPVDYGSIGGRPVTGTEFANARDEEAIRYFLNWGEWPGSGGSRVPEFIRTNFSRNVGERLVALRKLEELNVEVGDEAVVSWLRRVMRNADGAYDPGLYQGFVTNGLERMGMDKGDLFRLARHEAAMDQLRSTVGVGGSLASRESVEAAFRRENERRATEAVFFHVTNFLSKVKTDTNALRTYFTNRASMYREPSKVQVSYVRFDATNHLAEAAKRLGGTNDTDELDRVALIEARKAASKFANKLYDLAGSLAAEKKGTFLLETNFISEAKAAGLEVKVTEPFSQRDGLPGSDFPFSFTSAAFELGGTNLVRLLPVVGESSVFMIALNKRIASRAQTFEEVREDVTEGYQRQEALKMLRDHVREMQQKITNSIAGGKTFKAAAEELKLAVVDVPPFSQNDRTSLEVEKHSISFPMYQGTAFRTDVGEVCYPQTTGEAGFVLHVKGRLDADEAKVKDELDDYVDMVRQRRRSAAFQTWMARVIESSGYVPPSN